MSCADKMDLALLPPAQAAAGVSLAQRGLLKWLLLEELKRS